MSQCHLQWPRWVVVVRLFAQLFKGYCPVALKLIENARHVKVCFFNVFHVFMCVHSSVRWLLIPPGVTVELLAGLQGLHTGL